MEMLVLLKETVLSEKLDLLLQTPVIFYNIRKKICGTTEERTSHREDMSSLVIKYYFRFHYI